LEVHIFQATGTDYLKLYIIYDEEYCLFANHRLLHKYTEAK